MKTIKHSKEITTLEVGDAVIIGNLEHVVNENFKHNSTRYYLYNPSKYNGLIFEILNLKRRDFVEKLGIDANCSCDFPETKSLEALTAIVSALFKEYEKQNELPKTWEEFCERNPSCLLSDEDGEAFFALRKLRQLRKAYVKDWEPDWTNPSDKYCINFMDYKFKIVIWGHISHVLSFPTRKLAEQFLNNFKNLLEIAKPLL